MFEHKDADQENRKNHIVGLAYGSFRSFYITVYFMKKSNH